MACFRCDEESDKLEAIEERGKLFHLCIGCLRETARIWYRSGKKYHAIEDIRDRLILYDGGCLIWTGYLDSGGYGRVGFKKKSHPVHRLLWHHYVGPIPEGLVLDHLCKNPSCANIEHMEVVTNEENIARGQLWESGNQRKTHCPQGHPYDEANTLRRKNRNGRDCKTCHYAACKRKYYAKKALQDQAARTSLLGPQLGD